MESKLVLTIVRTIVVFGAVNGFKCMKGFKGQEYEATCNYEYCRLVYSSNAVEEINRYQWDCGAGTDGEMNCLVEGKNHICTCGGTENCNKDMALCECQNEQNIHEEKKADQNNDPNEDGQASIIGDNNGTDSNSKKTAALNNNANGMGRNNSQTWTLIGTFLIIGMFIK